MKISKDERFEALLKDCSIPKRERPKTKVKELTETEIKEALEIYRKLILSERE